MSSFVKTTLLLTAICMTWTTALSAEECAIGLPFPDNASPEKWIDGPDNVQPGAGTRESDVAVDNEGRRIHVWATFNTHPDRLDVYLRRWDTAGNPLEDPRRVNSTILGEQHYPRVAVSADRSFLVIFQSSETPSGETFDQYMVRSQAYDANGDPDGPEQLVSTVPTKEQVNTYADVAALRTADGSAGGYTVVWRNSELVGSNWGDIKGSLVSTAGVPGAEFVLNSTINGTERRPSVTELPDGGFFVVWQTGPVMGRHFNSAGGPLGPDFQISTLPTALATGWTDVAIGWDGRVLVVWEDVGAEDPPLPPPSNTEIRGRMFQFDASGNDLDPLGDDFRINNLFEGIQDYPRVAEFGPVGFLVIWSSDTVSAGPDTTQSIEGRVVSGNNAFDADGDDVDDNQVQFNVWDNNAGQNFPAAHGWYGRLATSWQSNTWDGEPEPDTINQIFLIGRDIEHCIFCDDFDWFSPATTDSLWRWTWVVPVEP